MTWSLITIIIIIYESPHQSLILLRSSCRHPKAWIALPHYKQGGIWTGTFLWPPQTTWKNYWFYTSKSQLMFRRVAQCIKRKRERHQLMYLQMPSPLIWLSFIHFIDAFIQSNFHQCISEEIKPMILALKAFCTTSWVTKNTHKYPQKR